MAAVRTARRPVALLGVVLLATLVVLVAGAAPAPATTPVPYDGPAWMARVAIVGDSFVWTTTPEIKAAVRAEWWRDATFSYPGVRTPTMRAQIRSMAASRPDAFVVSLGAGDTLALVGGEWDWNTERAHLNGVLDDLTAAGVGCVVWVGNNERFDGGAVDHWSRRINDELRAQLARRGLGVFADWTAAAAGRPEYFLADRSHFTPAGKAAFSRLIADALRHCTRNPSGHLDAVTPGLGSLTVRGWAHDPDRTTPIDTHVWIGGRPVAALRADRARPDVARALPSAGSHHGLDHRLRVPPGRHEVCVYAINAGAYGFRNPLLGCRAVTVSSDPTGSLDSVVAEGAGLRVRGWVIDPDTTGAVAVHLYVDGRGIPLGPAATPRPDVGAAHPGYGDAHGYDVTVGGVPTGRLEVCAYGINAPGTPGTNSLLGCRTVTR
jgi:hypothetical protein